MSLVRSALDLADAAGRLQTVRRPVDPATDLAAVDLALFETLRKASLFKSISRFPGWSVAGHLLADRDLWATQFGIPEGQLLRILRTRMGASKAPIQAAMPADLLRESVDLSAIPFSLQMERDTAPQFTAILTALDPRDASDVVGLVQFKALGDHELIAIDMPPALRDVHNTYSQAGMPMPVAVSVGADPALYLSGALSLGRRRSDFTLAGALLGAPFQIALLDGAPAPIHAEYVITGEIAAQSPSISGLNATLIGTYGHPQSTHVVVCNSIYRKKDPVHWLIAPATILALATELLLDEHIHNIEGGLDILDIRCLPFAGSLVAVVKLRPRVQGQAKTALLGSLSGAAYWVKIAIAVDEDIDASSVRDVLWSIASRTHAEVDIDVIDGLRMLHADPTAMRVQTESGAERVGGRWFIDSTMPALSQPERRATFRRAVPKNLDNVDLSKYSFD